MLIAVFGLNVLGWVKKNMYPPETKRLKTSCLYWSSAY